VHGDKAAFTEFSTTLLNIECHLGNLTQNFEEFLVKTQTVFSQLSQHLSHVHKDIGKIKTKINKG
jgi:hypothetical protein